VLKTPHIDFSHGPIHRAVQGAIRDALGLERLPSDLTGIESAETIVLLASDLEESHNVAALRIKDAVVKRSARLVVVSPRWGELVPFATAWLQPTPGFEAAAVQALVRAIASDASPLGEPVVPRGVTASSLESAAEVVRAAAAGEQGFAVVYAPNPVGAAAAGDEARACANLAIAARGDAAGDALHYLPTDANVLGISDMGVGPAANGMAFPQIIEAARDGRIKALLIHDDNPLLNGAGSDDVRAALEAAQVVVIDSVRSTAAEHADVVLAELPFFAKDGTITTADRRINRQRPAAVPRREERDGVALLTALANELGGNFAYADAGAVMAEAASKVAGYVAYDQIRSGRTRALASEAAAQTRLQAIGAPAPASAEGDGLRLVVARSLYTTWEGASMRSEEADKMHREEVATLNPRDAEAAGVRSGDAIVLTDGTHEVRITARLDDGVTPGTVYVPHYYDGGVVMSLLPLEGTAPAVVTVAVRALQLV
jgi:predicted molibdopterin-dependent oxidoreductase YjgC